jgi:hypothetical protein
VAPLGVQDDDELRLLTASAHVWPFGGITDQGLNYALGFRPDIPLEIAVSIPHERKPSKFDGIREARASEIDLREQRLVSGRRITLDVGPSSLVRAAQSLDTESACWLLLRALGIASMRSGRERTQALAPLQGFLRRSRMDGNRRLSLIADAVEDGCQSAGEVYVWHLLRALGVAFRTQVTWTVPPGDSSVRTAFIACDFYIDELRLVLEVDSRLHDHLSDVRRDLWNLTAGRRTARIVGQDVIDDPARALRVIAQVLAAHGWRGSVRRPVPDWLTAPRAA